MIEDLSNRHGPIGDLFIAPKTIEEWTQYRLTADQIELFHNTGYLAGIRLLNDEQIETLRAELADLSDPNHPGHSLFYEFHSNE